MENNKIVRLLKIITLLDGSYKKWTAQDMAAHFGISERTFHRDRKILEDIGVPLYYDSDKKTYDICDTYTFSPPQFTRDEAIALSLAARYYQSENAPYKNHLDIAIAKILNALPQSISEVLQNIDARMLTLNDPIVDLSEYQDLIAQIEEAIEKQKRVKIAYNSLADDLVKCRNLDPYNLILKNGACFVVGYCHLRNAIRIFRVDRIKSFEALDERFEKDENYSPEKYFKYSWGIERGQEFKVELYFKGVAAQIVREYNWHPSQEIKELSDGIIFRVRTSSAIEMKKWILGFGSEVEVKEPEWLRQELIDEVEKIKEIYK
ncbi:helix-turn-helix transcriptional regulator [Natronospora cellulosivora (SeqCode)]